MQERLYELPDCGRQAMYQLGSEARILKHSGNTVEINRAHSVK